MNISKESLTAHNADLEMPTTYNDTWNKAMKLGDRDERFALRQFETAQFGIIGGHNHITKAMLEKHSEHKVVD